MTIVSIQAPHYGVQNRMHRRQRVKPTFSEYSDELPADFMPVTSRAIAKTGVSEDLQHLDKLLDTRGLAKVLKTLADLCCARHDPFGCDQEIGFNQIEQGERWAAAGFALRRFIADNDKVNTI